MTGTVVSLKRFAVHDGDGIRTTVFLKGCPLACLWCHNPEGISFQKQLAYYPHKCIHCGRCADVCDANGYSGAHTFSREYCIVCGKCEHVCPQGAFEVMGKTMTVEEVLQKVMEDKIFYQTSGGGVTLSGGECMMQADFCAQLLQKCKENGLNTAVDTCGYVKRQEFEKVIPYTDTFLYDMKAFDEAVHMACTGKPNGLILENLQYLDSVGAAIEIRIPFMPNYNSDQMEKIAGFLSKLHHVKKVKILPVHGFTDTKYAAVGLEKKPLDTHTPTKEELQQAKEVFLKFGIDPVIA